MDSLDLKRLQDIMKNRKIDSTNIKIDLNKGIDLNFIPQNPSKDRLSEKTLTEDKIQEIKNKAYTLITDTTMRDAHQSLLATRMRTDDIVNIAEYFCV